MTRFLLDTSIILAILDGTAKGQVAKQLIQNSELITSIVCYCEVLNKASLNKIVVAERFLSNLSIFPLTLADGELAKEFQYSCRKSGKFVSTLDCLIAATASNNNATVITTDSDFGRIDGVKKEIF